MCKTVTIITTTFYDKITVSRFGHTMGNLELNKLSLSNCINNVIAMKYSHYIIIYGNNKCDHVIMINIMLYSHSHN